MRNLCKWDAAREVVTGDVYSSCSHFNVCMGLVFFFPLPVYEVSSASSFIIIHVSKTDLASVNG